MSKTVVITGASRGIGFEMIQQFAAAGHRVVALSRNIAPIQELKDPNIKAIATDLSNASSLGDASAVILDEYDRLDILIHNAGMLINKAFAELTTADFEHCYAVNVFGVAALTRALLPKLHQKAHVVAISSMGGIQGSAKFPGLAAYSSAKAAVITLFELLAEEYKESGPSFNSLALGAVQTEMLEEAFPGYQAPLQADEMAAYIMNFALTGHQFYNGKVLEVSSSTP